MKKIVRLKQTFQKREIDKFEKVSHVIKFEGMFGDILHKVYNKQK